MVMESGGKKGAVKVAGADPHQGATDTARILSFAAHSHVKFRAI